MKQKQKILIKAIELFNEQGVGHVTVRDIASAMSVSPGSISYHFKSQEELMLEIYKFMLQNLDQVAIAERLISGGSILEVARVYAEYVYRFRFFFQDTLDIIRSYPRIGKMHQKQTEIEVITIKNIVYMGVGNGTLQTEPEAGLYDSLCEMAWQTLHFWFARGIIRGKEDEGIEKALLITSKLGAPYYTEKGKRDLKRFEDKIRNYSSVS